MTKVIIEIELKQEIGKTMAKFVEMAISAQLKGLKKNNAVKKIATRVIE